MDTRNPSIRREDVGGRKARVWVPVDKSIISPGISREGDGEKRAIVWVSTTNPKPLMREDMFEVTSLSQNDQVTAPPTISNGLRPTKTHIMHTSPLGCRSVTLARGAPARLENARVSLAETSSCQSQDCEVCHPLPPLPASPPPHVEPAVKPEVVVVHTIIGKAGPDHPCPDAVTRQDLQNRTVPDFEGPTRFVDCEDIRCGICSAKGNQEKMARRSEALNDKAVERAGVWATLRA